MIENFLNGLAFGMIGILFLLCAGGLVLMVLSDIQDKNYTNTIVTASILTFLVVCGVIGVMVG